MQAKHAGDGHAPQISVEMTDICDSGFRLVIADNGIRLIKDIAYRNSETLGFQRMTSLAVVADGEFTIRINIPQTNWKQEVSCNGTYSNIGC